MGVVMRGGKRHDVDVVIVGGGPAGLSTALHLLDAAPRTRMVVLERARYPREKICAGAIGARGLAVLSRLGIEVRAPSVRIDGFEVTIGGGHVVVHEPGAGCVIRRDELDAELASRCRARGIFIEEGCKVTGAVPMGDGVLVERDAGPPIAARSVVGADGIAGTTRRAIGLPRAVLFAQAVEVDTERVASDPPSGVLRFGFREELRGYVWDFPTPVGGRVLMSRGVYLLRDEKSARDPREHLRAHLARLGLDPEAHRVKQLAERGWAPDAPMSAPRVLLVGEAAGIDFPTGEGIAQALAYGAVAGPYLAEALAADRLGFGDWRSRWLDSDEGRFLHRRHLGGRILFGTRRATIERALGRSPAVFKLALRRFAGRSIRRREVALASGQLLLGYCSEKVTLRTR